MTRDDYMQMVLQVAHYYVDGGLVGVCRGRHRVKFSVRGTTYEVEFESDNRSVTIILGDYSEVFTFSFLVTRKEDLFKLILDACEVVKKDYNITEHLRSYVTSLGGKYDVAFDKEDGLPLFCINNKVYKVDFSYEDTYLVDLSTGEKCYRGLPLGGECEKEDHEKLAWLPKALASLAGKSDITPNIGGICMYLDKLDEVSRTHYLNYALVKVFLKNGGVLLVYADEDEIRVSLWGSESIILNLKNISTYDSQFIFEAIAAVVRLCNSAIN